MKSFTLLLRHELRMLWINPATYLAAVLALLMMGFFYYVTIAEFSQAAQTELPTGRFFRFFLFPVVLLVPMLTMRSLADERRLGTLQTLMTTPVGATAVVMSKFCAAYLFYCLLWGLALLYPLITVWTAPQADLRPLLFDPGSLFGGYFFIATSGLLFVAIGIFTSSLTRSQLVAGMLSFSIIFLLIIGVTALAFLAPGMGEWGGFSGETLTYVQVFDHFDDAVRGMIDTRPLVYYLSGTTLVLGLSTLIVEART
ncbi:MAG: ABC transporter permease [Opitutales bacterium]